MLCALFRIMCATASPTVLVADYGWKVSSNFQSGYHNGVCYKQWLCYHHVKFCNPKYKNNGENGCWDSWNEGVTFFSKPEPDQCPPSDKERAYLIKTQRYQVEHNILNNRDRNRLMDRCDDPQ